jgi:PAS domain S-box-containing protein
VVPRLQLRGIVLVERESAAPRDSTVALTSVPSTRSAVIVTDADARIVSVAGALELLAFAGEPIGKSIDEAFEGRGLLRRASVRAVDAARQARATTVTFSSQGRELELSAHPDARGAMLLFRDASVRRRRAERGFDRELRLLFQQLPGAVWTTDRELVITRANGRVSRAMNLDPSEVVGMKVQDVLGSRDPRDPALATHLAALQGTRSTCRYLFRGRTFEIVSEPLREDGGEVVGTISAAIDVTESLAAAAKEEKSRRLLADAQRVAHVGCWEWDVATNVMTWSEEMHRIYDLAPDAFGGTLESFLSSVAPEDAARIKELLFDAYLHPRAFTFENRIVRPDGSVRMLHTRAEVLTDESGKPVRMLGSCWDTTEAWQTARALETSVSLLRATLEASADGTMVVDLERRVTVWNERFGSLLAVPGEMLARRDESEIFGFVAEQLVEPEEFLRSIRELHREPARESVDTLRFKDGRVFERFTGPQRVGSDIVGRVYRHRDVTERERLLRRAEFLGDATRLLASLDIESALSSLAHLAVPYLADSCAIDLVGESGPRRLAAVARDPERSVAPKLSARVLAGKAEIFVDGAISHMSVPLLVRGYVSGALSFAAARGARYTESDLALAEELGRRAALAVENARLFQSVQEALRTRDEFLAIAAHEVRGPLASMRFATQGLRTGKLGPSGASRALDVIERGGRRLTQFVDELLDLGMSRSGRFELVAEDVNLAHVVRQVLVRNAAELTRSGSSVETRLSEQAVGRWDRERIANVVESLLSNAIKFGLGGPIEIDLTTEDGYAKLEVRDHGIGISEEAQKRIFRPFERGVPARNYGGLGLGLYIASTIAHAFGGSLSVSSTKDEGTSFVLRLPLGRAVT